MKKILMVLAAGIFLASTVCPVAAYHTHVGPTEVLYYDASKAANGYTLFTPFELGLPVYTTYLIDMEGRLVNTWPIPAPFQMEKHAVLNDDNGNLLWRIKEGGHGTPGETRYQELDWDGNILLDIGNLPREGYYHHHTFRKIFNSALGEYTYISITERYITHEEGIQAGWDPELRDDYTSGPDGLVEFDKDGNVLWEWNCFDHLIQDCCPDKDNYVADGKTIADYPEKLDINFGTGRRGDWIHINSFDYNPETGQIVLHNDRNSAIWIIDHDGTFVVGDYAASKAAAAGPGGDILWRWGNPAVYDSGEGQWATERDGATDGDQQGFHVHDIQFIKPGLPGAGNLLQFDNGSRMIATRGYSAVLEINPYISGVDEGGNPIIGDTMVLQPEAGYHNVRLTRGSRRTSNQVEWIYFSKDPNNFYGRHISGCQRMPNGNTVVCSGTWGHFFEVTMGGELVWEYKNPVTNNGIKKFLSDGDKTDCFRVYRYLPDHPAFLGQDLTPGNLITETFFEGAMQKFQNSQ